MTHINTFKVFLFGDSICVGQMVSPHATWAVRLSESLETLNTRDTTVLVQNCGINGNTTRQALERMAYDITSHRPDAVLIQFGMNDCNYWETDFGVPRVNPRSFRANLEEMAYRLLACGCRVIFLCTNHPSLKGVFKHAPRITHATSNRQYNILIREVAETLIQQTLPLVMIDNETEWLRYFERNCDSVLKNFLQPDGVHLNESGHNLYQQTVTPMVFEAIRRLLP